MVCGRRSGQIKFLTWYTGFMTKDITDIAYEKAIEIIEKVSTKNGLYASGGEQGYTSVWARDSMISLMGASLTGRFKEQFKVSLETLTKYQDELGQIPNAVDIFFEARKKKEVTFATIDSTLWYIIGNYIYAQMYDDDSLVKKHKEAIDKAFLWISYQDTGNDGMPDQQPTSDWQDAFPHKYGHCINTQALYYGALKVSGKIQEAEILQEKVNKELWEEEWGFYAPYRWKNHREYREEGKWFDSFGNMLAIFFGLADIKKAHKILNHVAEYNINDPYPVKTIFPPISPGDPDWKEYYWADDAGEPEKYLNGGIWPFNGGFYVAALAMSGGKKEAQEQLQKLAEANKLGVDEEWEFHEWIDWNGMPKGQPYQAWSAGTYIMAYHAVKKA